MISIRFGFAVLFHWDKTFCNFLLGFNSNLKTQITVKFPVFVKECFCNKLKILFLFKI
jgi:hypothetical protein